MLCDRCKKKVRRRKIIEYPIHPKYIDFADNDGKKIYICQKCYQILEQNIKTILSVYIPERLHENCIKSIEGFIQDIFIKSITGGSKEDDRNTAKT